MKNKKPKIKMKFRCMKCNKPQKQNGVMKRYLGTKCLVCKSCAKTLSAKKNTEIIPRENKIVANEVWKLMKQLKKKKVDETYAEYLLFCIVSGMILKYKGTHVLLSYFSEVIEENTQPIK